MPPAPSSSFIPKRTPGAKPRAPRQKNIFILTIVSYSLFVAAPLASAGVFIYKLQTEKQFSEVVQNLDTAIASFKQSDFDRVLLFNKRLEATNELVMGHVSVKNLLDIISGATANTVQFKNLELTRTDQRTITIKADLLTSALDGALYQRDQYDGNSIFDSALFSDVKIAKKSEEGTTGTVIDSYVQLKSEFTVPAVEVRYSPVTLVKTTTVVPTELPGEVPSSTSENNNQDI